MSESKVHFFSNEPVVALLGNPNCGKTALFNLLTGSRQKVANYSGVTVERKEGRLSLDSGKNIRILDLPGEQVSVLRKGLLGKGPYMVRVGASTFALRQSEARMISVESIPHA